MKQVLFAVLNEFAEWEAAPLAAAVNEQAGWQVKTVSPDKRPVRSIGGFTVLPDLTVEEALRTEFAGLVLIGGKTWRTEEARRIAPLVTLALGRSAVVGAICDASVFLGAMGALNEAAHTGNQLADLQRYAGAAYTGAARYRSEQAVRDGSLVTANGTAALEFAREVLLALGVMDEEAAGQWYRFYKLGYYQACQ